MRDPKDVAHTLQCVVDLLVGADLEPRGLYLSI